jgi:tetratricopeptide (TPR) repeat protein
MTEPIRFLDRLFVRARRLIYVGQTTAPRRLLGRLTAQDGARATLRAAAHQLLGQLDVAAGNFRRARRHFAAAIKLQPFEAEQYARYAAAVEADPDADPRKGRAALRRALGIDCREPRYWAALGRAAARLGDRRRAVRAFRRAARLRPDTVEVLAEVVDGFLSVGRRRDAMRILTAARFRNPGDTGVEQLRDRVRFELLRRRQEVVRRTTTDGPVLLRFPGRAVDAGATAASPAIVRVDRGSRPTPHVLRMVGAGPDPRQAR